MIPEWRKKFNAEFSVEKYKQVHQDIVERCGVEPGFRLSESPVFLPMSFHDKMVDAAKAIVSQIKAMSPEELRQAIPAADLVPGDTDKPQFLTIDFGICKDEEGEISPQLIELQAFPSLYGFQILYEQTLGKVYPFLKEIGHRMPFDDYVKILKDTIVGDENPENVILMEIYPERQKTKVDFYGTEKLLGISTVCMTKIQQEGKKLFYEKDGRRIPIHRIYNRVIFDELDKIENLHTQFDIHSDIDVEWVTHPNWFFKVSKYLLPKLKHKYVPKSYFLDEFPESENVEDFVFKPLFSFAGSGINLHPTREMISQIPDKHNYIMQRKVHYEPLFEDINGDKAKAEIRMLMLWGDDQEDPVWVNNLVRMTKVAMVNVDFNKKDAIWIGSSFAYFV